MRKRHAGRKPPPWYTGAKDENGKDIFIAYEDAASYITDDFYTVLSVFNVTKTLGVLPFSGGWAEQPEWIARSLSVLSAESAAVDRKEREKKRKADEQAAKPKK